MDELKELKEEIEKLKNRISDLEEVNSIVIRGLFGLAVRDGFFDLVNKIKEWI